MSPIHGLLGLLLRGNYYGYELKRRIEADFSPFWKLDFAQLYRSLAAAARAGWVKAHAAPSAAGPGRKVYTLTAAGRNEFLRWLDEPAADRSEFLVKIHFAAAAHLPVEHLIQEQGRRWHQERLASIAARREALTAGEPARLLLADAALQDIEASCAALDLCQALLPFSPGKGDPIAASNPLVITGSDDPLLARLARFTHASSQVVGSLGGLLALSRGETDVAGVHLLDVQTGEYNVPFVKHILPEDDLVLVNLASRETGLMLAPGNPNRIRGVRDLARPGIRLVNRQRGAGTRLLLASRLRAAHVDPHALPDWDRAVSTHSAVAAAILTGTADVGPGLRAIAIEWGLDFVPLGQERFDLVISRSTFESTRIHPLLDALHGRQFRRIASEFQGYDLTRTGRVVARFK